jgi:hypothetical protein
MFATRNIAVNAKSYDKTNKPNEKPKTEHEKWMRNNANVVAHNKAERQTNLNRRAPSSNTACITGYGKWMIEIKKHSRYSPYAMRDAPKAADQKAAEQSLEDSFIGLTIASGRRSENTEPIGRNAVPSSYGKHALSPKTARCAPYDKGLRSSHKSEPVDR